MTSNVIFSGVAIGFVLGNFSFQLLRAKPDWPHAVEVSIYNCVPLLVVWGISVVELWRQ